MCPPTSQSQNKQTHRNLRVESKPHPRQIDLTRHSPTPLKTGDSLDELRALRTRFDLHAQTFKDWARAGGPINPLWVRETSALRRELHRAQCRAARRVFNTEQDTAARCLGAFLVFRQQRRVERERGREREGEARGELPRWRQQLQEQQEQQQQQQQNNQQTDSLHPPAPHQQQQQSQQQQQQHGPAAPRRRASLESLVPACNAVGTFQRFGERDIAFACDYCDGFIVWEDVAAMPATRRPLLPGDAQPNWQAAASRASSESEEGEGGEEKKTIVFAPVAIANHMGPPRGHWLARLTCPYCDQYTYVDQGYDGEEELRYAQDEAGFPDLRAFQEHLEWHHTSLSVPLSVPALAATASKCTIM